MTPKRNLVTVEFSPELLADLDAVRGSRSRSEVVRDALREYLEGKPHQERDTATYFVPGQGWIEQDSSGRTYPARPRPGGNPNFSRGYRGPNGER